MNFALLLWHIDGIMGFRKIKLNHRLDEIFLSNITQKKISPLFFLANFIWLSWKDAKMAFFGYKVL